MIDTTAFDQLAPEHQDVVRDMADAARAVLLLNNVQPRNDDHAMRFQEACALYLMRSFVAMRREFITDAPPAAAPAEQASMFSGFATSEPAPPAPVVPADPEPTVKAGGGGDYAGGGASDSWSTASSDSGGSSSSGDSGGSGGGGD